MGKDRIDPGLLLGLGLACVLSTLIDGWTPAGPWGQPSFTRGVIGLFGGALVYIAWFRINFGIWGLIPALRLWRDPSRSKKLLFATGIGLFFGSKVAGDQAWMPDPAPLLLNLIALLMLLLAVYTHLVVDGPWADEEE